MTVSAIEAPDVELTEFEEIDVQKVSGVAQAANGFPHLILKGVAKDAAGGVMADTDPRHAGSVAPSTEVAQPSHSPQNSGTPDDDAGGAEAAHQPWTGSHMHLHPAAGGPDANGDGLHQHMHSHGGDNDHTHSHGGDVVGDGTRSPADDVSQAGEMHGHGQPSAAPNEGAGKAVVNGKIDQKPDISLGQKILGLLGQAMGNESDEVSAGKHDEVGDVHLLAQAADLVHCWLGHEKNPEAHEGMLAQAVLTTAARRGLSESDFAIPETRSYPIHDEAHARNALSRVAQFGTASEKARVRAAVHRKYPDIGADDAGKSLLAEGDTTVQDDTQGDDSLAKAVAAAVTKALEPHKAEIATLRGELAKVNALPRPGGPVMSSAAMQLSAPRVNDDLAAKAQLMRDKAEQATDPADAQSYRQLARKFADEAAKTA